MNEYDSVELHSNCQLQLSEYEMLQSMYPGDGELSIDPTSLKKFQKFSEGESNEIPSSLNFLININVEKEKVQLDVTLPLSYPNFNKPNVFLRCTSLSKIQHNCINQDLNSYLKSFELGDLCIGPIVTWLQENADGYYVSTTEETIKKDKSNKNNKFVRMWIYSHHIYSKTKRKDMLELARQHCLSGFCLPGKPGIICIEGFDKQVEAWWHEVRKWTWQKLICKNREEEITDEDCTILRRFPDFEELGSENNIRIKSGGFHVDMGDVFKYLELHKSGYMFQEYFGFSGKS